MPEIPRNTNWLFADDLKAEGNVFEFVELLLAYKTPKSKEIPAFVLIGETEDRQGEFICAAFNIDMKAVETKLGKNTDTWGTPRLRITPIPSGEDGVKPSKMVADIEGS